MSKESTNPKPILTIIATNLHQKIRKCGLWKHTRGCLAASIYSPDTKSVKQGGKSQNLSSRGKSNKKKKKKKKRKKGEEEKKMMTLMKGR